MNFMNLKQFSVVFSVSKKLIFNTEVFVCAEILEFCFGEWLKNEGFFGGDDDGDEENSIFGF